MPWGGGLGFDGDRLDRLGGACEGGLESEALIQVGNVVVDRLGYPDQGDPRAAFVDHLRDAHRAAHGAVTADDEQNVDPEALQAVNDRVGILRPA
jgi:hypothetical protein